MLAATGAKQVDLVGHSQGGMMPRYFLRFLGGAARSARSSASPRPTTARRSTASSRSAGCCPARTRSSALCQACEEQEAGSPFLTKLNAGGETVGKVRYTVIESANDEVVTPYTSAFMSGKDVTNILLQQQCPLDQGEHLSMPYDHIADADVLSALDPAHPVTPACTPVLPVAGG